jgi:predicted neuraminidase
MSKRRLQFILRTCLLVAGFVFLSIPLSSQNKMKREEGFESQYIFPLQSLHVHGSSLVELPNGDLLCCWFEGSGERSANDVRIMGSRLTSGTSAWSTPFVMADTPGQPDCNPVLFLNRDKKLFLFWIVVRANRWECSLIKYLTSDNYDNPGPPTWTWQDVLLLKPGDEFAASVSQGFKELPQPGLAWAEYAPPYEQMIIEAAGDPKKRETGWMTRIHPVTVTHGRILLPLYSDGYNLSLVAISDDQGNSWKSSLPIVGRGNVQPSIVCRKDGTLTAFMRDNGDAPGRIMISTSEDNGFTWSPAQKSTLPNPGSSVEAIVLKNGHWLLVYNDTESGRNSLAVSISEDEGKTWPFTRHIERVDKGEGSFSYPSVIRTRDQTIHVTYSYQNGGLKSIKYVVFSEKWVYYEEGKTTK